MNNTIKKGVISCLLQNPKLESDRLDYLGGSSRVRRKVQILSKVLMLLDKYYVRYLAPAHIHYIATEEDMVDVLPLSITSLTSEIPLLWSRKPLGKAFRLSLQMNSLTPRVIGVVA